MSFRPIHTFQACSFNHSDTSLDAESGGKVTPLFPDTQAFGPIPDEYSLAERDFAA